MHFKCRLAGSPLIVLITYAPGLLAQQQYCLSGAVTSIGGAAASSIMVGDPVAITATVTAGTVSCTVYPGSDSLTVCSAGLDVEVHIGTRHWSSMIPASLAPPGPSAGLTVIFTGTTSNTSELAIGAELVLSPYPTVATQDVALGIAFQLYSFTGNLLPGGTLPVALPTPDAIQVAGANLSFSLIGAVSGTISYTGQDCAYSVTLLDPFPTLLDGPHITTAATITDALPEQPYLADLTKGTTVSGVATDGVAQVVLRILASSVGETFAIGIRSDQCMGLQDSDCINEYGLAFDPISPPNYIFNQIVMQSVTVAAVSTPAGPMAFAAYRAPLDFVRDGDPSASDQAAATRSVFISISSQQNGAFPDQEIKLVRPQVVLIHGLASNSSTWDHFEPLRSDSRFSQCLVDYGSSAIASIDVNAPKVGAQITDCLAKFRQSQPRNNGSERYGVAAAQADVVGHSMGGLLVRAFSNLDTGTVNVFTSDATYAQGPVHKLITIGTPHSGTPLADALQNSPFDCDSLIFFGFVVSVVDYVDAYGALADLATTSDAIRALSTPNVRGKPLLYAHVIVGVASTDQETTNSDALATAVGLVCPALALNLDDFETFYGGPNDNVVPDWSQQALGRGYYDPNAFAGVASATRVPAVIHAVIPYAFPLGPDELARILDPDTNLPVGTTSTVPSTVIDLLNSSVASTRFSAILP